MSRSKDDFIERTGGLRLGESDEDFRKRVVEIDRLTTSLVSGKLNLSEVESVQRKICTLKGIDFDSDNE